MNTTPLVYVFPDNQTVAEKFAEWLAEWIKDQEQAEITIALSGGSTPKVLFKVLAEQYAEKVPWEKVRFFWGDERCVPPDHNDSNYKMTNDLLLAPVGFPADKVHRVLGEINPADANQDYIEQIKNYVPFSNEWPRFDLIILGMGGDGHTASIFPHEMELLTSDEICAVATHPESGQKRVSLTGKVINNARNICFLVTGASKQEKVYKILKQVEEYQDYPAAHIQPTDGSLSWNLDEAAVTLLKSNN
ncbi:MAG: 6-phosphogluconolactonase [Bacteroidota bacterium]